MSGSGEQSQNGKIKKEEMKIEITIIEKKKNLYPLCIWCKKTMRFGDLAVKLIIEQSRTTYPLYVHSNCMTPFLEELMKTFMQSL